MFGKKTSPSVSTQPQVALSTLQIQSSALGASRPIVYGQQRLSGNLLDFDDFVAIATTSNQSSGGKGGSGPKTQASKSYSYTAGALIALCEGPIRNLYNVWDTSGQLTMVTVTETFTIPTTPFQQTVAHAATFYDDFGVTLATAYSFGVTDYGDIARTLSGTYQVKMTPVGGTPTTGQYKVAAGVYTFAAADVGKTVQITYAYTVSNTLGNGVPLSQLNLTFFNGAIGQSAWATWTSKHSAKALGYSGLAYVANDTIDCGSSGSLPNYSYEIIGLNPYGGGVTDCNPADIITDLWTNSIYGLGMPSGKLGSLTQYSNYCIANGLFLSYVLDSGTDAASLFREILDTTNSDCYWSGGKLQIVPYGDTSIANNGVLFTPNTTPQYDLDDDDYVITSAGDEPITIDRNDPADAMNYVQIEWLNRANNYNTEITPEFDQNSIEMFGIRKETARSYHGITTSLVAQTVGNFCLKRNVYIRNQYTFTISGVKYVRLEPMDLVTVSCSQLGLNKFPVRILTIEEGDKDTIQITAEEFPFGTATATAYPKQAGTSFSPTGYVDPGNVNAPLIFEASTRLSQQAGCEIYMGVSGSVPANYGGCSVWMAPDGVNFKRIGRIYGNARMGVLTASLAANADPDTTGTLAVDLSQSNGSLGAATHADADANRTMCVLVDAGGTVELVNYGAASLTSANHYNLTYLRRGVFATTSLAHTTSTTFCRLDDAMFVYDYDPTLIGSTVTFKFTAFNSQGLNEQPLSAATGYSFTINGVKGAIDETTGVLLTGTPGSPVATIDRQIALATGTIGQNALDNPGFDTAPTLNSGDVVAGWTTIATNGQSVSMDTTLAHQSNGSGCLLFLLVAGTTITNGSSKNADVKMNRKLKISAGEVYNLSADILWLRASTFPAGVVGTMALILQVNFSDSTFQQLIVSWASTSGYTAAYVYGVQGQVTIPTPSGKTIIDATVLVQSTISNTSGSLYTAGTADWDAFVDNFSIVRAASIDSEVLDGANYARTANAALQGGFPKGLTPGRQMVPNPGFELNYSGAAGNVTGLGPLCDDWIVTRNDIFNVAGFNILRETSGQAFDGNCNIVFMVTQGLQIPNNVSNACAALSTPMAVTPGKTLFYGGMGRISMNTTVPTGMGVRNRFSVEFYDNNGNFLSDDLIDFNSLTAGGASTAYTLQTRTCVVPAGAATARMAVWGIVSNFTLGSTYTFYGNTGAARSGSNVWSDIRYDDVFMFEQLDPSQSGQLAAKGSVPPAVSGGFGWVNAVGSFTLYWDGTHTSDAIIIYRADGTTTTVPTSSTVVTVATGNYYLYPYWDETTGAIKFVTGGTGTGTFGAICFTAPNLVAAQAQQSFAHVPLSLAAVGPINVPSSGGGSTGGGGGSGKCLRDDQVVNVKRDEKIIVGLQAINVKVGDQIECLDDQWEEVVLVSVESKTVFLRLEVMGKDGVKQSVVITPNHIFEMADGSSKRADELQFSDYMKVRGGLATLWNLGVVYGERKVMIGTNGPTHVFLAGEKEANIAVHNVLSC